MQYIKNMSIMQYVIDLLLIIVFYLLYLLLLVGSIYALIKAMCSSEEFKSVELWKDIINKLCIKINLFKKKRYLNPVTNAISIAFFGIMDFLSCKIKVRGYLVTFLYLALVAGFAAYLYSLYGQYTSDDGFSQMEQIQLIVGVIFLLVMCCVNVFSIIRYKPYGEDKENEENEKKNYIYGSLLGMISNVVISPIKNNYILLSLGAIMVFGIFKGWFSSKITFDSAEKVGYAITFMMGIIATIFGITLIIDNLDVLITLFDKICEKPKSTHRAHKPTKYNQDGGGGRKRRRR